MAVQKKDPALSTKQAAEYMGRFSVRTLERWRKQSRDSGTQVGPKFIQFPNGDIGYRLSSLDEYLGEHEFVPESVGFSA